MRSTFLLLTRERVTIPIRVPKGAPLTFPYSDREETASVSVIEDGEINLAHSPLHKEGGNPLQDFKV